MRDVAGAGPCRVSDDAIKSTDPTENSYPFPTIWTMELLPPRVNTLGPKLPMRISGDLPPSAHAVCTQVYSVHAHSKVRRILAIMEHSETALEPLEIPGKHTIPCNGPSRKWIICYRYTRVTLFVTGFGDGIIDGSYGSTARLISCSGSSRGRRRLAPKECRLLDRTSASLS